MGREKTRMAETIRKIMIGTPCYDGRLDVWYTNSLINTIMMGAKEDIHIIPIWVSFDALIQRARNDTIYLALEYDVDALVFIDSDIEWDPEDFFKLINSPHDVIGGTYRKKSDTEEYVVKSDPRNRKITNDLLEVQGLGTGFAKLSRDAMTYLWETSAPYIDRKDNKEKRMVCDVVIENMDLVSEDISMFKKLTDGGFKVYLDTSITCNHTGPKKFVGDFRKWFKQLGRQL